jgi:hypothetical protein
MAQTRRRRWPWLLGGLALLLVAGAIFVNTQLEPHRLAATVLGQAGASLQLRLSYEGTPEYAFRPEPRLVLPSFRAASLDGRVFLSAKRVEVSLPWSTITGNEPVITRIELDSPVLDLPGLRRWQATRPPTPFKLPTLSRGLAVKDGTVVDASWSVRGLSLDLPHLKTGDTAKLSARGTLVAGKTTLPFEAKAIVATPGLASPLDLHLVLPPTTQGGAPVAIALQGRYEWADPRFTLQVAKLGLVGKSPIPSFEGSGQLQFAESTSLDFEAVLSRWPQTWPALPPALAAHSDKLPVQLRYRGKSDFSDELSLLAARDDTQLRASLRWPELQQWLAAEHASPLPPLRGTLKTPSLDFDGVTLEGVEVEISEGGAEAAP